MLSSLVIEAAIVTLPLAQTAVASVHSHDDAILEGRVLTPDSQPLAGVLLEVRARSGGGSPLLGRTTSRDDGRFSLEVLPTPGSRSVECLFLQASAVGWAATRLEDVYYPYSSYDLSSYNLGEITLHPPVELRGRVTDGEGSPVSGAGIYAALGPTPAPNPDYQTGPITTTNQDGEYACHCLPPGLVTLGASAKGLGDLVLEPLVLAANTTNVANFALGKEVCVRFQVRSGDGAPIPSAIAEPIGEFWNRPWVPLEEYQAFWRRGATADDDGWITVEGWTADLEGFMRVVARGFVPQTVRVPDAPPEVVLAPATPLQFIATERSDGSRPELFEVFVRDDTREPNTTCGAFWYQSFAKVYRDSLAVTCVAPHHWRVQWNGLGCYVDGGAPSRIAAIATDGTRATVNLSGRFTPGSAMTFHLDFEEPVKLAGVVRDTSGAPVAVRLGTQLSLFREDRLVVKSDDQGRFSFDKIGPGTLGIDCLEEEWVVPPGWQPPELKPGESVDDLLITVAWRADGRTGVATGFVTIDGDTPSNPVLLALDLVHSNHLPNTDPHGLAWTDVNGRFEVDAYWPGRYHIVPKHHADHSGGWRSFANEFPEHDSRWPWTVQVPATGSAEFAVDFPSEAEWDGIAPQEKRQ